MPARKNPYPWWHPRHLPEALRIRRWYREMYRSKLQNYPGHLPATEGLPSWWRWPAAAMAWASLVVGGYAVGVAWGPFHEWSRADQLSLFQSAIGLAGFGAGAVALWFAGMQLATRFGKPKIDVQLQVTWISESAGEAVFKIWNFGGATPPHWRLVAFAWDPFTISSAPAETDVLYQGILTCDRDIPLLKGRPAAIPFTIQRTKANRPGDVRNLDVNLVTEYGVSHFWCSFGPPPTAQVS
ncbi:MAG TPA: hypothetical protein VEZ14_07480 [Dehalococcoidia bacterium]|nr:hypothetical protein [Dehalococcoidia bacterium]